MAGDAEHVPGLAHAAREHQGGVRGHLLVLQPARVAQRDHPQRVELGEAMDHLLPQPLTEVTEIACRTSPNASK